MTSTKTTGKLNMTRNIVSRFPAKILGGLAVGAFLMTTTFLAVTPSIVSADDPASPLVSAAVPTDDQLIDDLGEWGFVANTNAVTPSYEQLIDDMGEFGRVASPATSVPSYDQLIDDLEVWPDGQRQRGPFQRPVDGRPRRVWPDSLIPDHSPFQRTVDGPLGGMVTIST